MLLLRIERLLPGLVAGLAWAPTTAAAAMMASQPASSSQTAIMVPVNYTVSVFNSDCPCDRRRLRYCTRFLHRRVRDGRCYPISHYAHSTRVLDPLVSERNRLSCRVYTGLRCDGAGFELTFVDNTRCREPRSPLLGDDGPGYRSFVCSHASG